MFTMKRWKKSEEITALNRNRLNDIAFIGGAYLAYGIAIPIIYLGLMDSLIVLIFTTPICIHRLYRVIKEANTIIQKQK